MQVALRQTSMSTLTKEFIGLGIPILDFSSFSDPNLQSQDTSDHGLERELAHCEAAQYAGALQPERDAGVAQGYVQGAQQEGCCDEEEGCSEEEDRSAKGAEGSCEAQVRGWKTESEGKENGSKGAGKGEYQGEAEEVEEDLIEL